MKLKSLTYEAFVKNSQAENALIIDTRLADFFETAFLPKSINIGLNLSKGKDLGEIINTDQQVLLICKPGTEEESLNHLEPYQFKEIIGFLEGGMDTYLTHTNKYDMVISISSEELVLDSLHNPKAVIIDVRSNDAFEKSHVYNAVSKPLNKLAKLTHDLNPKDEIIIYCTKGNSSMTAASYLKKQGFIFVKNVWGGFERIVEEPKVKLIP
jgi:hydroxyacylglutathione hydrolase